MYSTLNHDQSKEFAFPYLTPAEYQSWRLRMYALFGAKKVLRVVKDMPEPPRPNEALIARLTI